MKTLVSPQPYDVKGFRDCSTSFGNPPLSSILSLSLSLCLSVRLSLISIRMKQNWLMGWRRYEWKKVEQKIYIRTGFGRKIKIKILNCSRSYGDSYSKNCSKSRRSVISFLINEKEFDLILISLSLSLTLLSLSCYLSIFVRISIFLPFYPFLFGNTAWNYLIS